MVEPVQLFAVGVRVMVATMGSGVALVAVNEGTLPVPLAPRPIPVLSFTQLNTVPATLPVSMVTGTMTPSQWI